MGRSKKKSKQITIEDVLVVNRSDSRDDHDDDDYDEDDLPIQRSGRKRTAPPGANSSPVPRMSRRGTIVDDDEEEDEDGGDSDDTIDELPRRSTSKAVAISDDDDDDDDVRPAKRLRRGRQPSSGSDDSSDDLVILTPPPKQTPSRLVRSTPAQQQQPTISVSRSARKSGPRSARQRHMELLRRRRLGEKVTESDLEDSFSDEEQPRKALYDKDPDHVALSDFEDDDEEAVGKQKEAAGDVEEAEPVSVEQMEKDLKRKWKKDKKKKKKEEKRRKAEREQEQEQEQEQFSAIMQLRSQYDAESDDGYDNLRLGDGEVANEDDEEAEDMADFIDDSHTGLLGAPDGSDAEDEQAMLRREIPLQFTFQAHKPLKSHFKDAIEWLVHRRVNPGGVFAESDDELYKVAWGRLDREVGGLAQSRFISSVWTPEFYGTLRARPYMDSFNIRPSGGKKDSIVIPGMDENVCHACGRTNHPASFRVMFSGKAYDSKTLDDIEEADSDEEDEPDDDHVSIDMNGNSLPPTSRQWYVGVVCHSNAETAHDLLHWRRALKDWVEEKLQADHLLDQLEGRKKKMKTKKRRTFANNIVDDWEANGTVDSLFRDFSKMLEGAQAKSTKTLSRFGR
ncbi:transcription factor iiic-like protein [Sporothrix brasiliensis 5110]|uniref:Transcription factor iiic-like protein n=1 Tax=Sporothrix brasiliensis 5110 TaxID=1398154 RepID=A0A0C2F055_9PEZI|nr:transcription factor iiic-like protein [Sporothrix brasiliensis 5110]KIH92159.1 transcription factor iiic-like protein [Sporothrix brasiliensis 5110]